MKFYAQIPDNRKAFEIPGSKSEARLTLSIGEDQVPSCLRLILWRGQMFDMHFQIVEPIPADKQRKNGPKYRIIGNSLSTLAAISAKDGAIKINGVDGMSITFAIPTLDDRLLVRLLGLREKYLRIRIPEQKRSTDD